MLMSFESRKKNRIVMNEARMTELCVDAKSNRDWTPSRAAEKHSAGASRPATPLVLPGKLQEGNMIVGLSLLAMQGLGWTVGVPGILFAVAGCSPTPKSSTTLSQPATSANAAAEDGSPDSPSGWRSPMAVNLSKCADWTSEMPFVNAFRESREWIPQLASSNSPWTTGAALNLDQYNNVLSLGPDQAAGTLLFNGIQGHYSAGTYTLLYDGSGSFKVGNDGKIESEQPGRIEIKVATPTDGGIHLKLTATDASNPVRNIQLLVPTFLNSQDGEQFHPSFLQYLTMYQGLRFMDWQSTNDSPLKDWSERTTPSHARQTGPKGVAVEIMLQLANNTLCDPWFCMPHQATNEFVTQFATLVRDQLDPSLKVFVEYSNEVWNSQFQQHQYAQQQGLAAGLSSNPYEAGLRFYSQRSVEMFDIWHAVFGAQSDRVVRVLAGQAGNPWTGEVIMDWKSASSKADAYAVAPYFGGSFGSPQTQSSVATWSVDKLMNELRKDMLSVMATNAQNASKALQRGLPLIAYEGGQHLAGHGGAENNVALTNLFHAANRDRRMGDLYTDYLNKWRYQGGQLFAMFNSCEAYSKWGAWGLMEYVDSPRDDAPKFEAVRRFVADNHQWWP